jgi:hypothetical protein
MVMVGIYWRKSCRARGIFQRKYPGWKALRGL